MKSFLKDGIVPNNFNNFVAKKDLTIGEFLNILGEKEERLNAFPKEYYIMDYNKDSPKRLGGMLLVSIDPTKISYQEVAKLEGVFLHPTKQPNDKSILALLGTAEQFNLVKEYVKKHKLTTWYVLTA